MIASALADPPAWYVVGPLVGLVLVTLYALLSVRMGVLGGVTDVVEVVTGRRRALGWKAWFVVGIVLGAALFGAVGGPGLPAGYGWMTRAGLGDALVASVLVTAGVLIGYGAKHAGGCTSGNGLSGTSFGSPGSVVALVSFMVTAIATSLLLEAMT